jgi:hypothetical protein
MKNFALKLTGLLSIALAVALLAPQRAAADEEDPPGRIARLSFTHGAVSFQPAGTDDWVSAVVNRPMTTGDKLWSDKDSRAELHIGTAAIRLSENTGFSFLNLTDNTVQLQLTAGTLNLRVRRLDENETFEVDTPNLAFTVLRPGKYRINVNEAGDTTIVIVRDGQGEVTGGGSAYTVHPDEIGTFTGTEQLEADVQSYEQEDDDFDTWCNNRDRRMDHSTSSRYVSDDVVGYEDLDDYGGWRSTPDYGTVWFPHVTVVGWAPYRYGHWVWISPWGWTWVEDEPWGFAPFHYGRWVVVAGYWGWVPCAPRPVVVGAVYVRPVYAPALVAWVGGPHWGVGIGVGGVVGAGVAWFPLGPREVYVPSYHVSQTYVTNVNISNTTVNKTYVTNVYNTTIVNKNVNVTNIKYVNQNVPGAVTATSHEAFTSARPVSQNLVKVDQKEIASAPVSTNRTPNVTPQKQSVLGAGATAKVQPPTRFQSRAVIAKTTPPPPAPAFEKQQAAIKANGGKPLAISETRQLQTQTARSNAPAVKIAPPAKPATPQNAGANRTVQQQNTNRPPSTNNTAPTNVNEKKYNDRPPSSRPVNPNAGGTNTKNNQQLDQKHQQETENLRSKQDQERQKIEQQQLQERQKLQQQQADEKRREQLNQQHQQQLEAMERKHDQEQQQLQQKQQQERQKAQQQQQSKPPKQEKEKPKAH